MGATASGPPELDVLLPLGTARVERVPRPGARILALHAVGADSHFFWCVRACEAVWRIPTAAVGVIGVTAALAAAAAPEPPS